MCVCVDEATDRDTAAELAAVPRSRIQEVNEMILRDTLEENRRRPEPWPICADCGRPVHPQDREDIYPRNCSLCGLNRLERLFWKLSKARGRKARKKATRRLVRFARTGR
jgi:hypothetical protein